MAHLRKQIRDAVKTSLTGLSTTSSRVYQTRHYPAQDSALPCLLIYTTSENSQQDALGGKLMREMELQIEGLAKATSALDDTLDAIAKEIEVAMATDPTFGGTCKESFLTGTEITFNAEGERPVGSIRLTYRVIYRTARNNPETLI